MLPPGLYLVLLLASCVLAPFPANHSFHFANPAIEPWWETLDNSTQQHVYSTYERQEPFLLALAEAANLKRILKSLRWKSEEEKVDWRDEQRGYRVAVEEGRVVKHAVKKREAETGLESSSSLRQDISPKLNKVPDVVTSIGESLGDKGPQFFKWVNTMDQKKQLVKRIRKERQMSLLRV